jgi:hypothetical protein
MERVFHHDRDCWKTRLQKLPSTEFQVFDFNYDEAIGTTCDAVAKDLQTISFHDKETPMPPGHHIDFGHEDCNFDDRACECLPSPRHSDVSTVDHRRSMVRTDFMMACDLNMAEEAAHQVVDMEKIIGSGKLELCPAKVNPKRHLSFCELSLLFGGHCMLPKRGNGKIFIDQIAHKDGETKEGLTRQQVKLKDKHKPGSFIIPLDDFRTMFVCTPLLLVTAKRGQCLWFHGALPHGGRTCKASNKKK